MRIKLLLGFLLFYGLSIGQGTTTSDMRGRITDLGGEALIGANVVAVHEPSGTTYGTATDIDGYYRFSGMRVGGPYSISVTYTGFAEVKLENVHLRLGEGLKRDFTMDESSVELNVIQVLARAGITGQSVGASTQITSEEIQTMPTLDRDIDDFLKLTPQANLYSDGISFAGVNNRYNAIYIDGAVNNDVFGLAASGTNGGQTGISPFSIDIIDQFQVVLSPYDVSLGGFAGGGINAVTKSGTNEFSGTAYFFTQNENFAGKTNGTLVDRLGIEATKLDEFSENLYGASLGGPIVQDKAFFFANVEIQRDETPIPFEIASYDGDSGPAELENLRNHLINTYGYDPGGFGSTEDALDGLKLFGKLDINLSDKHRLTLRHQFTKAEQTERFGGRSTTINFSNNGVYFPSTTNSSAIELNSRFSSNISNNLIIGFSRVNDDRDAIGGDFPYVFIEDGAGLIRFGTEEFSTANALEQSIFTLTDNLKLYKGDHTFTFGTHNEFYSIYNLFIPQNYGTYDFESVEAFINGEQATDYVRAYSLVDDITGDGSAAASDFNAVQFGLYAQDEWNISRDFTLTFGVRVDMPIITTDPVEDTNLNNVALPQMREFYDIAEDVEAGKAPDGQIMFSPRAGFEYDLSGARSTILRGGVGVFTSRIPFVWPGSMFNSNGLTQGRVVASDIPGGVDFRPEIGNQYTNPNFSVPSGQVDLFTKDFKYPQVLRGNLALDHKFPGGFEATVEGIYTKTLNNVVYTQINSNPTTDFTWTGIPDNRPVYVNSSINSTYSAVYVGSNTSEGYTYTLTATLAKNFPFGLNSFLAYSYNDAHATQEGTSSQNSSQWRGQISIDGRNNPVLGRSDFAIGHRVIASLGYKHDWSNDGGIATSINLFFNGQSGTPYSYVIAGFNGQNPNRDRGSTSRNRSLVWVPASQSEINLVDYTSGGATITAAQQWENLNSFIEDDPYLSEHRGGYADKNGAWAPFTGLFDLSIRQDFGKDLGGNLHKIQVSLDMFNLANLINSDWGVVYSVPGDFNNYFLYQMEGYEADGTTPRFTYRGESEWKESFDILGTASRWRMRLGVRYLFN